MCSEKNDIMQLGSAELFMQESKFLIHGNGKDQPPTGFMFEKEQMHGLYFNQSPSKVLQKLLYLYTQFKKVTCVLNIDHIRKNNNKLRNKDNKTWENIVLHTFCWRKHILRNNSLYIINKLYNYQY